jgi:hypothetical protein
MELGMGAEQHVFGKRIGDGALAARPNPSGHGFQPMIRANIPRNTLHSINGIKLEKGNYALYESKRTQEGI